MNEDIIIGRNPVMEAISSGRTIDKILIREGNADGSLHRLIKMAKDKKIPVMETDKRKLGALCGEQNHQGVVAFAAAHEYATVEDILNYANSLGEPPFIVICDKITDPHNLGAIIRTARAAGVHGVIIPKHESVSLNFTVAKVAAGALEAVRVAKVTNIAKTIDMLKEQGLWVTGADAGGDKSLFDADMTGAVALVIGSEGNGISRLVKEKCDFIVSIPMKGGAESLNASVAAALMMYKKAADEIKNRKDGE